MNPSSERELVLADPWPELRRFTQARLALGRVGDSLPTQAVLDFGLAHARARDAVLAALPRDSLTEALRETGCDFLWISSDIKSRQEYLRRPDLGRRLNKEDRLRIGALTGSKRDLVIVVADGLSAQAIERHAAPLLLALLPKLAGWKVGPLLIAEQARVALGDEIGELLRAEQVVVLIGERPGLSSPDSLGAYLTHHPRVGRADSERNCISNIRLEGLGYELAAHKLHHLLMGARHLGLSGIELKDETDSAPVKAVGNQQG